MRVWVGDVAMTFPKPSGYGLGRLSPADNDMVRIRDWAGHRRYDRSTRQDPAGAESLDRARKDGRGRAA